MGAGYSYIDYDVAKWAGIVVAKRINNVYDDFVILMTTICVRPAAIENLTHYSSSSAAVSTVTLLAGS